MINHNKIEAMMTKASLAWNNEKMPIAPALLMPSSNKATVVTAVCIKKTVDVAIRHKKIFNSKPKPYNSNTYCILNTLYLKKERKRLLLRIVFGNMVNFKLVFFMI